MSEPWIYTFGEVAGTDQMRPILGGKGLGLTVMTRLGLPVPPGFTITTEACAYYQEHSAWPEGMVGRLEHAVSQLESEAGRRLGDPGDPLLLSVRSGAAVSMPGMMETVLDLGMNDQTVEGLATRFGDSRFAWDSYRRFILLFGDIVLGVHYTRLARAERGVTRGREVSELSVDDLKELCAALLGTLEEAGKTFPFEPREQLRLAIEAVMRSYNSHRARYYRKAHGIADDAGTAVNVQAMVFGNLGETSATGVAFTRNPKTGERGLFGEWLPNAQGEDVVAGTRTPWPLNGDSDGDKPAMSVAMPVVYAELERAQQVLEAHFGDMQDIEFTVERGQLYLLQTRTGKRTAQAAVRIVVDLVEEGVIDEVEAISRIEPVALEKVLRPVISPDARRRVIAKGLDASPGAACGRVVFHAADVQEYADRDEPTVLVRNETAPEDIQGMTTSEGILTARGGQTSHAAVVARSMGKPAVVGCTDITVDYSRQLFYAGDTVVRKGDWITIDGGTGEVMEGKVHMLAPDIDSSAMSTLLGWADERAHLKVRANADNGGDAARARSLGAVGLGLCRTEHMFFKSEALRAIRRMILADDPKSRQLALKDILPLQREVFRAIFRAMDGLPVTIRLLDPPLHEFLPSREEDVSQVARELGVRVDVLQARLDQLQETNPMCGHRGVRLGVTTPEVYRVQVRAIFEAACELVREGVVVIPEVMIPLVSMPEELERIRDLVVEAAEEVIVEYGTGPDYRVGSMIELPRAALLADKLARFAEFFSFGTNDLTQMTYGISRDDLNKFLPAYQRVGLMPISPLVKFDVAGVGQLVEVGAVRARLGNAAIKLGVSGEHGSDPTGVGFFHRIGLDYVSCSPYRVPVARLAAAHAALGLL